MSEVDEFVGYYEERCNPAELNAEEMLDGWVTCIIVQRDKEGWMCDCCGLTKKNYKCARTTDLEVFGTFCAFHLEDQIEFYKWIKV
jgi:hypothetical protein